MYKNKTNLEKCKIIPLPRFSDERGDLTFIEQKNHVPFSIKRIYYLYGIVEGKTRGNHAHKRLEQLLVAISGSFDIILDDGVTKKKFKLNRPYYGLYIAPLLWREMINFSSNAVCMVLASDYYKESDYLREYEDFIQYIQER